MSAPPPTYFPSKILTSTTSPAVLADIETFIGEHSQTSSFQVQWLGDPESSFKIDDVRSLQELLGYSRSPSEEWWYVITNGDAITLAAQHALLKVLEEPPPQTHICIVASRPHDLLPTIQSRCITLAITPAEQVTAEPEKQSLSYTQLKKLSYAQLVDHAAEYKSKEEVRALFESLLTECYTQLQADPTNAQLIVQLQDLQQGLEYLYTNINSTLLVEQILFKLKHNI